jgi:hypothetical protein
MNSITVSALSCNRYEEILGQGIAVSLIDSSIDNNQLKTNGH